MNDPEFIIPKVISEKESTWKIETFPEFTTERLVLNKPTGDDLQDLLQHMNSTPEISDNTLSIPYPYTKENAEVWFRMIGEGFENQDEFVFAIREKLHRKLIGGIGIHLDKSNHKAEVGYWLGKSFWNKGYVSEALQAIVRFGFDDLKLNKIYASHFVYNPSSGKVLLKNGFSKEAEMKGEIYKNGKFLDIIYYSIFR